MSVFLNAHTDRLAPGSFQQPVPIPAHPPDEPDLVTVCFNKDWLPYILGSLLQLTLSTTWQASTEAELLNAFQMANTLLLIFQQAKPGCAVVDTGAMGIGGDDMCCCLRMQDGILQVLSCGVWTDVPGWSKSAIAPGQPGAGSPQPQPGGCQIFQGKITPTEPWLLPVPVSAGDTIEISNLIGSWSPSAFTTIWDCPDGNLFFAGNCVDGTAGFDSGAPMPSAPLNGTIIFDGTNYYDVSTAANLDTPVTITILPGVSNAQALVRCNFHGGVDPSGEVTFTAKVCNNQVPSWSVTFDFTMSTNGWTPTLFGDTHTPCATWVAGQGFQSVFNHDGDGYDFLDIWLSPLASAQYTACACQWVCAVNLNDMSFGEGDATSFTPHITTWSTLAAGSPQNNNGSAPGGWTGTGLRWNSSNSGESGTHPITLQKLIVSGTGPNPFGP